MEGYKGNNGNGRYGGIQFVFGLHPEDVTLDHVGEFSIDRFIESYGQPLGGLKSHQTRSSLRANVKEGLAVLVAMRGLRGSEGSKDYDAKFEEIEGAIKYLKSIREDVKGETRLERAVRVNSLSTVDWSVELRIRAKRRVEEYWAGRRLS
ncbi:hypothetical protein HY638_03670 [Candidatus Woesearchaeota archaeon]|nr:hypothetical protein [Candidatus Woesearchaeota archaeon]